MFLLKKLISPFLMPITICIAFFILGLLLLWFTRRQKGGKILITVGMLILLIFCYASTADLFLNPLEYKYKPLVQFNGLHEVKWVVVLGGGHISDPRHPVNGHLSGASLARLVEGIRIYKKIPGSKLVLSGGAVFDPVPEAKILADVALVLGVYQNDVVMELDSRDTKDQAIKIGEILGTSKFILVTSASHMMRSLALFRKLGLNPIPAPTDYLSIHEQGTNPRAFFPSSEGVQKWERIFYEYLGLVWAKLRGQV